MIGAQEEAQESAEKAAEADKEQTTEESVKEGGNGDTEKGGETKDNPNNNQQL